MGRNVRGDGSIVLNPGYLRDQITWQQRVSSGKNSFGEDQWAWSDFVTCHAQILPLQGRELLAAQQYFAEAKYQLIQHYTKGLKNTMRIAWCPEDEVLYLNVLSIDPSPGMRQYQTILAKDYEA